MNGSAVASDSGSKHAPARPLLVLGAPARRNRHLNPYNFLLSEALSEQGCDVRELTRRTGLFCRSDVVHIHWPQTEAAGEIFGALYKSAMLLSRLAVQRLNGSVVVWTVHNVHAHDQNNKRLEAMLMRLVIRLVDGLIFMTEPSRIEALREIPGLAGKPWRVIPHGLYPNPPSLPDKLGARAAFGLPADRQVVGFTGDIRPYKGLDSLLEGFRTLPVGRATLFIAGSFQTPADYADQQRRRIELLRQQGHEVVLIERRLDDNELATAILACDVNVLPYRKITNSGFALLVLGLGKRILATDAAAFRVFQNEVGAAWVSLIDGKLESDNLTAVLDAAIEPRDQARLGRFLEERSWHRIATLTRDFYKELRRKRLRVR